MKSAFKVFLCMIFLGEPPISTAWPPATSKQIPKEKKGLILFLDGIPASGKSSLAKELKKHPEFDSLLSSDEYAEEKHANQKRSQNPS